MVNPNNNGNRSGRVGNVTFFPRKHAKAPDTYKLAVYLKNNFKSVVGGKSDYHDERIEFTAEFWGNQSHGIFPELTPGSIVSFIDTLKSGDYTDKDGNKVYGPPKLLIESLSLLSLDRANADKSVKAQGAATGGSQVQNQGQGQAQQPAQQMQPAAQAQPQEQVQAPQAQQTQHYVGGQPVAQNQAPAGYSMPAAAAAPAAAPQVNMTPEQMLEPNLG